MAERFDFNGLVRARDRFKRLSAHDFSGADPDEASRAAARVGRVNGVLGRITGQLVREMGPGIDRIHRRLVQLDERL